MSDSRKALLWFILVATIVAAAALATMRHSLSPRAPASALRSELPAGPQLSLGAEGFPEFTLRECNTGGTTPHAAGRLQFLPCAPWASGLRLSALNSQLSALLC